MPFNIEDKSRGLAARTLETEECGRIWVADSKINPIYQADYTEGFSGLFNVVVKVLNVAQCRQRGHLHGQIHYILMWAVSAGYFSCFHVHKHIFFSFLLLSQVGAYTHQPGLAELAGNLLHPFPRVPTLLCTDWSHSK